MKKDKKSASGKLRIGDDWNAITIIALSQNNPLKAIAEFVENSIDAKAKNILIVRGREHREMFLKIMDDGEGIPKDENGAPDFKYVATHICDSIKRRLKHEGRAGIQGEFGIGLLSFWTVGEHLRLLSSGDDGKLYAMSMTKGHSGYTVTNRKLLIHHQGTELIISPLLSGVKQIPGEKIQRYLASELRDRIRKTDVHIRVIDRIARREYKVEPRQFPGQLLRQLGVPLLPEGEIYMELYLNEPKPENQVGLYRSGTRVLENITRLDHFQQAPWTLGYLAGIVDAPFLNLTPGTRDGIILDDRFAAFTQAMTAVEENLQGIIREHQAAEEERTSQQVLRTVQNALKEALLFLPQEEYDWFDVHKAGGKKTAALDEENENATDGVMVETLTEENKISETLSRQKQFFDFPGPLFKTMIAPRASILAINAERKYRAISRDRSNKLAESSLVYGWEIAEGQGRLDATDKEMVTFTAPPEPGLVRMKVTVQQGEISCSAEALVTVTETLFEQPGQKPTAYKGIPSYTYQFAAGELWRSRYDKTANVIVVNNGHRDFVFASKNKACKLRYICRLFVKELVLENFPGLSAEQLLERMTELSLYVEENL